MDQGLTRRVVAQRDIVATVSAREIPPISGEFSRPPPGVNSSSEPKLNEVLVDGTLHCSVQEAVVVISPNRAISDSLISIKFREDLLRWTAGDRKVVLDITHAKWLGHDEIFFPILDAAKALTKRGAFLALVTMDDGLVESIKRTRADRCGIRIFRDLPTALEEVKK